MIVISDSRQSAFNGINDASVHADHGVIAPPIATIDRVAREATQTCHLRYQDQDNHKGDEDNKSNLPYSHT